MFGLTVRSRNAGSTKQLVDGRRDAEERLIAAARELEANAVVAFRYDTSELGPTWTEICAYGTAVRARKSA